MISLLAVLAPMKPILLVTGFLIFADLLSGVLAAKKRGEPITSHGLRRTLSKTFVYNMAIISGFLVERYLLSDFIPILKITSSVIGISECISIFENLNTIDGSNIFKKVVDLLGSKNDTRTKEEGPKDPPTV